MNLFKALLWRISPNGSAARGFVAVRLLLFAVVIVWANPLLGQDGSSEVVRIIFDTDMAADVDDVGALATLHALEDLGEAEILAVGVSDRNKWTPLAVDAINSFFGHPEIPLGVTKDPHAPQFRSQYTRQNAEKFSRSKSWESADDAPDAVDIYRKVLTRQPEGSVVFVSVGFLTNMSNLLKSKPDRHSDLHGLELVKRKVQHWVCMGGGFPEGAAGKQEFNIQRDLEASRYATSRWPTPITFSGFGIGREIKTGSALKELPKDNPVREAYRLFNGISDRQSWDQSAVLYAVRGLDEGPASNYWSLSSPGRITLHEDGSNGWKKDPDGIGRYLIEKREPEIIAAEIERLMKHRPQEPRGTEKKQ